LRPFDADGNFAPTLPDGGQALRRIAVRGAGMTILSGAAGVAIQIASAVVLGRLLHPVDFGLVTMVTTFSILLMNAPANGVIDSTLQRKEVTEGLASTMFWVNIAVCSVLSVGFIVAAPLVARFYSEPLTRGISIAMSATILLYGVSIVHASLLRRAMQFTALAKNDIIGRALGVVASIGFAMAGWGYWSLVIGACTLALSVSLGVLILCPWMPRMPRRRTGARSAVSFGTQISGRFSVNYFARNADNLLVGWRFGAGALGFYKKAYDLFALSASQLVAATSSVAVAALSRVRDDRDQYFRYLLGAVGVMSMIGMGLAGDLTLVGKDVIRVLLGPGWEPAGVIFTWFAPGIGMMMVYYIHGWIHVSIGRADRWFIWGIVEWTVTIGLFLIGLHWGPKGIAIAWCASFWVLMLPSMAYAGKPIGLRTSQVIAYVWRYLLAALVAAVITLLLTRAVPALGALPGTWGAAIRIVLVSAVFISLYICGMVALYGGTEPLRRMRKLFREMRAGEKQPVQAAAATEGAA
jgi:PST family polysaccharide transporter